MHEIVIGMKAPKGYFIDHRDSNGLNNTRENLRIITIPQNSQNRLKRKGVYTSDYLGVYKRDENKYYASSGKYSGVYETEEEAAKAYDIYAIYHYGVDAKTNGMLTDYEKEDIVLNGIPEEYNKTKIRDLPKNIYQKKGSNRFYYKVIRNFITYSEYFDTLDECIDAKDILLEELEKKNREEHYKKDIIYDDNNEAIIHLRNKNGVIVAGAMVDNYLWHDIQYYYSWYLNQSGYVASNKAGLIHIYLYTTYVGEIPEGMTIDHADQNPLNNKLSNLRPATPREQSHNQKKAKNTLCRYKGVSINRNIFRMRIDDVCISGFKYEEDAARKYNELAILLYGDKANLNDISEGQTTVADLFGDKETIDLDYIKNIRTVEELKQLIRTMNWGQGVYFKLDSMTIYNFEECKEKAIQLFNSREEITESDLENIRNIPSCNKFRQMLRDYDLTYDSGGPYRLKDIHPEMLEDAKEVVIDILRERGYKNKHQRIEDNIQSNLTKTEVIKLVENIKQVSEFKVMLGKYKWSSRYKGPIRIQDIRKGKLEEQKKIIIDAINNNTISLP